MDFNDMEYVACNLCSANNTRFLYRIKEQIFRNEEFNIVKCKRCGLIYCNPQPSSDEVIQYYPKDYHSFRFVQQKPFLPDGNSILKRNERTIKTLVLKYHYGYFSEPTPKNIIKKTILKGVSLPFKYLFPFFPLWQEGGGKLLDIGCATGHNLSILRELGWNCYGVEHSEEASQWAREKLKLNVMTGSIEEAVLPDATFDVVILWHVIEHLKDPRFVLTKIRKTLKKGGLLVLGLPVFDMWEIRVLGKYWDAWDTPRHLWFFTRKTIDRMLRETGFKLIRTESLPDASIIARSLKNRFLIDFPILKLLAGLVSITELLFNINSGRVGIYAESID